MIPGEEEDYVSRLLGQLSAKDNGTSVALALRLGHEVVVGCTGGATAYVFRDGVLTNVTPDPDPAIGHVAAARLHIVPSECLVLLGEEVSTRVEEKELRQTVQASFSVQDAAAWLVTLAAGRSGKEASAIVAQVQSNNAPKVHFAEGSAPPRRLRMPAINPKMAGLSAAGIAVLIVAFVAASTVAKPSAGTALLPVTNLTVVHTSSGPVLSWGAAPGASAYVVSIKRASHATQGINYTPTGLSPGKTYSWRVKALYGSQPSHWSAAQIVTAPLAPPLGKPVVLSPGKTVSASQAKSVYFCWSTSARPASYDLKLSGGHKKYNHSPLAVNKTKKGARGGRCYIQALPPAAVYSWQLGAKSPGHFESWTAWRHFTIEALPTATPVPTTPQYPVYSSTPTAVPTVASYSTPSGSTTNSGTNYQPATTQQSQSSQSSGSSSGGSSSSPAQPAPTSPVTSCANPPNC